MAEIKVVGPERWFCEPVRCIAPPTVHMVGEDDHGHLRLMRLIDDGTGSHVHLLPVTDDTSEIKGSEHEHL